MSKLYPLLILLVGLVQHNATAKTFEEVERFMHLHVEWGQNKVLPTHLQEISARDKSTNYQCPQDYKDVFTTDEIDIHITFGYGDNGQYVEDRAFAHSLVKALQLRCPAHVYSCGFIQETSDDDPMQILTKLQRINGSMKFIRLHITYSAASGSDNLNRSSDFKQRQLEQTRMAEDNFFGAIKNSANAVFYVGHSRDGGGPSFAPPKVYRSGDVNYPYYRKNKPGLKKWVQAMNTSHTPPAFVASVSCYSNQHFTRTLRRYSPNAVLLMSNYLARTQNLNKVTLTGLDSLLGQKCYSNFKTSLDNIYGTVGPETGKWNVYNIER